MLCTSVGQKCPTKLIDRCSVGVGQTLTILAPRLDHSATVIWSETTSEQICLVGLYFTTKLIWSEFSQRCHLRPNCSRVRPLNSVPNGTFICSVGPLIFGYIYITF